MEERVQKILAKAGFGSRRACETIISAGRVRVNGTLVELGSKANVEVDSITVDNRPIPQLEAKVYIALYKPRGVLSTVEAPDSRPTVRQLIPLPGTLYPVGRLDVDSEGLTLLTNDGELADRLTHPKYHHAKEYRVLVARQPDNEQLEAFRHGVVLADGYRTAPAEVHLETPHGKGAWITVILFEGRKRQIRETCAQIGLPVVRIIRTRIATLKLGSLKPGQWRNLAANEIAALKKSRDEPTTRPRKILRQKPQASFPPEKMSPKSSPRRPRPKNKRDSVSLPSRRHPPVKRKKPGNRKKQNF